MQKIKHNVVESISHTLEKNYMPYAMSVIVSRAIPEIDGFKPSHRKLLYTMYKMGLLTAARTKSANVVGQTMKLNPHGDAAIYETMVRLTRGNASLLHPYVDSKGNFGKQYSRDMQYAASRYTEVKLDKLCEELFRSIDKDVVDFVPNYDGSLQEPTLLPATFPSILVNANQGIAVGMASNICPFHLGEICEATIQLIALQHKARKRAAGTASPQATALTAAPATEQVSDQAQEQSQETAVEDDWIREAEQLVLSCLKGPDFPGGGELLYDEKEWLSILQTGRGSLKLRARYRVDKKQNLIEVYEIPYTTTVEAILDQLSDLVKAGKVKEISDVRDETDLSGLKLTLELKRSADPEALMQRLFLMTSLQNNFACNFNLLIKAKPQVLGVVGILQEWLEFRRGCVRRETSYDLKRKKGRLHLLLGLQQILLDIDKAIRIIRETEAESEVVPNLAAGFGIDSQQAEYIAEIKLRHLNREYLLKRLADQERLEQDIAELEKRLSNPDLLDQYVVEGLRRVQKDFAQERRTQVVQASEVEVIRREDLIEDYRLKLFLTEQGYLKKLALTSLRSAGELKLKEEDKLIQEVETSNRAELLLFSNQANCYKLFVHELKDCKPSELGEYLPALLEMSEGEKVVHLRLAEDYQGALLFGYENGKVSRVPLESYRTKTKRKKLLAAYSDKSPLVGIVDLLPEQERLLFLKSNLRKALVVDSALLAEKASRSNQGVQVMTAKRGSKVEQFCPVEEVELLDRKYYQTKGIPAIGYYMKEGSRTQKQRSLDALEGLEGLEGQDG